MHRRRFLIGTVGGAASLLLHGVAHADYHVYLPAATYNMAPEPDWTPEVPLRNPVWYERDFSDLTYVPTLNEGDVIETRSTAFKFLAPDGLVRVKWSLHYVVPMPEVYQIRNISVCISQGLGLYAPTVYQDQVPARLHWMIEACLPANSQTYFLMSMMIRVAPVAAIDLPPENLRPYNRVERWA